MTVMPPPQFKHTSYTYNVLKMAKFFKGPFTKDRIMNLRCGEHDTAEQRKDIAEKTRKSLAVLERNGLIKRMSATEWEITNKGIQYIREVRNSLPPYRGTDTDL